MFPWPSGRALTLAAALVLAAPSAARAGNPAEVLNDVVAAGEYQLELPVRVHENRDGNRTWIEKDAPGIDPRRLENLDIPLPDSPPDTLRDGMTAFEVLLWAVAGVGVIVLVVRLFAMAGKVNRARPETGREAGAAGAGGAMETPPVTTLSEADRLAAERDYGAAMHVLMLSAIEEVRGRLGAILMPSLTSREIVDRVQRDGAGGTELSWIVGSVELNLFGGRSVNESVYRECRDRYLSFIAAGSGTS